MPMHVDSSAAPPPQMDAGGGGGVIGLHAYAWSPLGSPFNSDRNINTNGTPHVRSQQQHSDDSANALSFGFLATAILVSMFLVMAIFEKFLRRPSRSPPDDDGRDVESQSELDGGKLRYVPSPKVSLYDTGVSVLMPGDEVPSFIALPAPITWPLERPPWPPHHQQTIQCRHPVSNTRWSGSGSSSVHHGINVI